jgi:hypothetical protein
LVRFILFDGHATYLLTRDRRDFGELFGKTIQGVTIVSPRLLAQHLETRLARKRLVLRAFTLVVTFERCAAWRTWTFRVNFDAL